MSSMAMKIVKIGDYYLNFENVTHAEFETTPNGLICTIYFNCQIADPDGGPGGVQASKSFHGSDARDLKAWLELRIKTMEPQ